MTNLSVAEVLRNLFLWIPGDLQTPAVVTAADSHVGLVQIVARELADFGAQFARESALMLRALVGVVEEAAGRRPLEADLNVVFKPVGNEQMVLDVSA